MPINNIGRSGTMPFHKEATNLIGNKVQVHMTGHSLTGQLSSVGTDFMVMRVRKMNRIRRVIIRLSEIIFLFALI
jgi:hypothetical protein